MKRFIITTIVLVVFFTISNSCINATNTRSQTLQEKKEVEVLIATATIGNENKLSVSTATPQKIQKEGDFLLEIPSIELTWIVKDISKEEETNENWGIPKKLLDEYGIVRFPHFAYPGQEGVVALAGHRDMSGLPFLFLDRIQKGDDINILLTNKRISYKAYDILYVLPNEIWILEPQLKNGGEELRLITCLVGSTKKRLIIFARKEE